MRFRPSSDSIRRPIVRPVFASSRKKSRMSLDKLTAMGVPRSADAPAHVVLACPCAVCWKQLGALTLVRQLDQIV